MNIHFEKINNLHQETIFTWLTEPHMQEFWDNSQEHKDDIINFINGRATPSKYFNGIFTYWIGMINNVPFCFILTAEVVADNSCNELWINNMSKNGTTYSLDFGIGNKDFLGKKLAAPTLNAFTEFFKKNIDSRADTFFIDPDENNPRAKHVYAKAGFNLVGEFKSKTEFWDFGSEKTFLMVKKI